MQNKLTNHDRITKVIENAVVQGSGNSITRAASTIDSEFILIAKSDLPPVEIKPVYSPSRMENIDRPVAGSASLHGKAPSRYYWDRARSFIAIAQYAEQQEAEQVKRELDGARKHAYSLLYPTASPWWEYETADLQVKTKIDVVVNLMRQVDELKANK